MFGAAQTKGTPNRESSSRRYFDVEARISSGGDFKNKDLHRIRFDRVGSGPYYTRPMPAGLPDRVDCVRLAEEGATLERDYAFAELARLQDRLADREGSAHASFAFEMLTDGHAGARVAVRAVPSLVCQRCLRGVVYPLEGSSEIEFAGSEDVEATDPQREVYVMKDGLVSLRELAEEELLLALPIVAAHDAANECGGATVAAADRTRPFAGLKDLLKKT
jgi:uncharacterized protein